MKVKILREAGYEEAMLGLSLSKNQPVENMPQVASRLYDKPEGHNKFLESIRVWYDITAPRYWWQQFDTYRIMTKQSGSTMHTVMHRSLEQADFEMPIWQPTLNRLNAIIGAGEFEAVKMELPEGFLQRRVGNTEYSTLRRIIGQRMRHRLQEWQVFVSEILAQIEHKEFFVDLLNVYEEAVPASATPGGR